MAAFQEVHLILEEKVIPPSEEWAISLDGWRFLRISEGVGYWCSRKQMASLEVGDVLVQIGRAHV